MNNDEYILIRQLSLRSQKYIYLNLGKIAECVGMHFCLPTVIEIDSHVIYVTYANSRI